MIDTLPLLGDAEVAALRVPGIVPDPEAAARYLTGTTADGAPHAVRQPSRAGSRAAAVCGTGVRVTRPRTTYDRTAHLPARQPCWVCIWHTALAVGSTTREIRLHAAGPDFTAGLVRAGVDALLAVKIIQAILADYDITAGQPAPVNPETVTLLAHVSAHQPSLDLAPACARGECDCKTTTGFCPGSAICWACTAVTGQWAEPSSGLTVAQCRVKPPCSVIQALTATYRITQATSPLRPPGAARQA